MTLRKQLAALEPQNTNWQVEVSNAYVSVGKAALKLERWEDAVTYFMSGREIDIRISNSNPGIVEHVVRWARAEANLGGVYKSTKADGDATDWFKIARHRLQELRESEDLQGWAPNISQLRAAIDANLDVLNARTAAASKNTGN
ncbi:MAG: hypothetical protein IIC02_11315 [Planctomycetes bacterium]|nr:hypothetical protein [Planctomycetota bacterium]